ncbi:MAG: hypothetical protein HOZ81_37895 [Streptomyces sp.]|nr:hypothetical protein [Streptomyces sp.]NUT30964.1 hypothetical protein [Streptomyces sp.]
MVPADSTGAVLLRCGGGAAGGALGGAGAGLRALKDKFSKTGSAGSSGWWWSVAADHLLGRPPRERTDVTWPGDGKATVAWLRDLRTDWLAGLDRLDDTDLDTTAPFPWPNDPQYSVAHMIGWVNAELMKNAAEIGQLRLLRVQVQQPGH